MRQDAPRCTYPTHALRSFHPTRNSTKSHINHIHSTFIHTYTEGERGLYIYIYPPNSFHPARSLSPLAWHYWRPSFPASLLFTNPWDSSRWWVAAQHLCPGLEMVAMVAVAMVETVEPGTGTGAPLLRTGWQCKIQPTMYWSCITLWTYHLWSLMLEYNFGFVKVSGQQARHDHHGIFIIMFAPGLVRQPHASGVWAQTWLNIFCEFLWVGNWWISQPTSQLDSTLLI